MNEVIKVKGMMCAHCEKRVEKALLSINVEAVANSKEGTVTIKNCAASREEIVKAIVSVGYEVI